MLNKKSSLSSRVSRTLVSHPWKFLLLSLLVLGIFAPGLAHLEGEFGYRIWFKPTDPLIKSFDKFEKQFGNDDTIVILMESKSGIFDKDSLSLINEVTEKLWLVEDIIRVDSLTNYQWTHAQDDELIIENLIPEDSSQLTPELIASRKKIALNHEVIPNYLINKEGNMAMIFGLIKPSFKGSPKYQELIKSTKDIIDSYKDRTDHSFHLNGASAINDAFREVSTSDMKTMIPLVLLLIILVNLYMFRRASALLTPFLVIGLSLLVTFGLEGLLGIKFNNILSMIPTILIAIAIADTIHILVTYYQFRGDGNDRVEATYLAFDKNITPTFLTSVSTCIGFLSFSTSAILPLSHLGILAAFGTMMAWVFTLISVAPILVLVPVKVKSRFKKSVRGHQEPRKFALKLIDLIEKHKGKVLVVFIGLFVASIGVGMLNEINSNPYQYFTKDIPVREANDLGLEKMGGANGPEIVINTGIEDGIKDPAFLKKVEEYQTWLESKPYVTRAISIINILKSLNRSFHDDNQKYYVLPEGRDKIGQLLFLYTMSLPQGMDINDRITVKNDSLRITLLWSKQSSKGALLAMSEFEDKARELGLNSYVTGKIPLYQKMNKYVVKAFSKSITMAIVLVGILMIIVFKSWRLGLMSMLPNVIPLGYGAALMTILGKPIDIGTVLVTSVCLGIAVDDTIHFLTNYNKYINEGSSQREALAKVLSFTGPALFSTTMILVAGFGVFAFADFVPNVNFGILTALVLVSALVVDLVFLPALLLFANRKKSNIKENKPGREDRDATWEETTA
jgi:predicted RND superfamily exporter protein